MRSGITRRWLCGSLLMTVLLVLLVEGMFLYSCTRSYYNSVQQTMYRRFSSISGQLKMYTGDTAQKASASRSVALRRMVEQFSDKDKYEFMLLDSYGSVIASSSGTDAEGILTSADFEQAQETGDGMGVAIYRTDSNEMVMAVCCLVPSPSAPASCWRGCGRRCAPTATAPTPRAPSMRRTSPSTTSAARSSWGRKRSS